MTENDFFQKYMSHLTEQQAAAVRAVDGPVLLLAVPGSGKTTVLVTRLGFMVHCRGIEPEHILTMTYTKAATEDMRSRFSSLFGSDCGGRMDFRTINSLSKKVIEHYSRNAFPVADDKELAQMVRDIYRQECREYPTDGDVKGIRSAIGYVKNMMYGDEDIRNMDCGTERFPEIYRNYNETLKQKKLMDFDDQMRYALTVLRKYPDILDFFQRQFPYICVDEAQDTSKIQHEIIRLLASRSRNLFMVGDEDQSIYGFRAAYPEALAGFSDDYPDGKVLFIEENFRSTEEIVAAAGRFVARNRFRRRKEIRPAQGPGTPVRVIRAIDRMAQFKYLFESARDCQVETAVLFRNNDSALPLIDVLERNGIPFNCRRFEEVFFSNPVVSDIADILALAYEPLDAGSFLRVYSKMGWRLTKKDAQEACRRSQASGRAILDELLRMGISPPKKDGISAFQIALQQIPQDKADEAVRRAWCGYGIEYWKYAKEKKLDAGKFEILSMLGQNEPDAAGLLRRLRELQAIIQEHGNRDDVRFTLSTIHSSKGLEYDRVFLLDVFDGMLPGVSEENDIRKYEEERRLYYVAMTRAKKELCLFSCQGRDSAFTDETLCDLPREACGDELLCFTYQDVRGKTYRHAVNGKGRIIAHSGDDMLLEYESGLTQILTVSRMLDERDRTAQVRGTGR